MAAKRTPDDQLREAWELADKLGSMNAAARELGLPQNTIKSRIECAIKRLGLPPINQNRPPTWAASLVPTKERTLEKLLEHKRDEAKRAIEFEEGVKLLNIKLETPGPIGLMVFGDPHIDSWGCDFNLLEAHLKIAKQRQDYIYAGNIGDIRDNWIARLSMLVWQNTLTAKETWKLAEWLMHYIRWTWLIRGNHDCWSGDNDPLDWISKQSGVGVDRDSGVRIAFKHPNGKETRLHARHDFPGRSMYNANHGLKREILFGHRDHIVAAGHLHIGMDSAEVVADQIVQMVRVSGYKRSDQYRHSKGFHPSPIHPAALVIVDPELPEGDRARCFCTPTIEEGAAYLDWKRAEWENRRAQARSVQRKRSAEKAPA